MKNNKLIFLSGGGDSVSAKEIDDLYGQSLGIGARVLYIPVAWENSSEYDSCLDWFNKTYERFKFKTEMLTDLSKCGFEYLEKFDSIYISGGNTFLLMNHLRKTNFSELLIKFINSGKVVYGGSAGAIILGKDIRTATLGKYRDENTVGINSFSGLDMVNGTAIHCHYEKENHSEVEQFAKETQLDILALTESSGLFINGDEVTHIGEVTTFN